MTDVSNARAREYINQKFSSEQWLTSPRRQFSYRVNLFDSRFVDGMIASLHRRTMKVIDTNDIRFSWDYVCCPKYGCSESEIRDVINYFLSLARSEHQDAIDESESNVNAEGYASEAHLDDVGDSMSEHEG